MTIAELLLIIGGITLAGIVITFGGFILFARWSKRDQQRRAQDTEVAQALRAQKQKRE